MKRILLILLLAVLNVTIFAQNRHINDSIIVMGKTYYGNILFPKTKDCQDSIMALKTRIFECFKKSDTLLVITDSQKFWDSKYSCLTRSDLSTLYKSSNTNVKFFDEDVPYIAQVISNRDTLVYIRDPVEYLTPYDPYELIGGSISDFSIIKLDRNINSFCEQIKLNIKYLKDIRHLIFLTPCFVRDLWLNNSAIEMIEMPYVANYNSIEFKIEHDIIISIIISSCWDYAIITTPNLNMY